MKQWWHRLLMNICHLPQWVTLQWWQFSSNFKFDQNIISGEVILSESPIMCKYCLFVSIIHGSKTSWQIISSMALNIWLNCPPENVLLLMATDMPPVVAWINNHIHYNVWDEITYPVLNFNGATVEIYEWISNSIPHFTGCVITHPCWDLS